RWNGRYSQSAGAGMLMSASVARDASCLASRALISASPMGAHQLRVDQSISPFCPLAQPQPAALSWSLEDRQAARKASVQGPDRRFLGPFFVSTRFGGPQVVSVSIWTVDIFNPSRKTSCFKPLFNIVRIPGLESRGKTRIPARI